MIISYKKLCTSILILLSTFFTHAQTTTATYSAGDISTDDDGTRVTTVNSSCAGTLTVNVPVGRYVTGVDVSYDMEALGFNFISDQWSYIECITTGNKDTQINSSFLFFAGVQNYSRNGLNIANGVVAAGGIQFKLHAFRDFGFGGCGTTDQIVNNNSWTITVHHVAAPTCLPPTNLSISAIGTNQASLSWTTGGASNWQIEYGSTGFTSGTGTVLPASTNPFTVTGLSPNTTYDIRLRDSCGLGDVSFWTPFTTFTTNCSVVSAPWSEDFESSAWASTTIFGGLGDIDDCFERNSSSNMTFVPGPPIFSPFNSGPSGDHTSGSGTYMYSEVLTFGGFPVTAEIKTLSIDLSALTTPEMSVWYHMFGTSIGTFDVSVSDNGGTSYSSVFSKVGQQQTSKGQAWDEAIIDLSTYANATVIIRFRHVQSAFGTAGDVAIDDISIYEQPTCPKPIALTSTGSTTSDITLSWTTGGASNWQIEYGPAGFTPGTGTVVGVSTNPYTISGLSANTAYDIRVQDSCGLGDVSFWTTMGSFRTSCSILVAPWSENFESSDWAAPVGFGFGGIGSTDTCFTRNTTASATFIPGPPFFSSFNTGPSGDHTTGSGTYMFANQIGFGAPPFNAEIITPAIDLTNLTSPEMSVWYHMFGGSIGTFDVEVSNNNGLNYTNIFTKTGAQQTSKTDAWDEAIIDLSTYINDTIILRFKHNQTSFGAASEVSIDDINVYEKPSCTKPSNLAFVSNTTNSITVDWTTGGATNWQLEYGLTGFTPGTGTVIGTSTNPTTINGLSPSTGYDVYVQDSCGIGDVSFWVGPITVTTGCGVVSAPYSEDFESSFWTKGVFFNDLGTLDTCWDRTPVGDFYFKTGPRNFTFGTGSAVDHSTGLTSGKYIYSNMQGFSPTGATAAVQSVSIDLSPLTVPELTFWYHMFGNDIEDFEVRVSNNGGNSFSNELTITGQQHFSNTDAWVESVINLAAYANDTVILEFRAIQTTFGFNGNVCIDDVDIHEAPSCPKPQNLSLDFVWLDNATISWTSGGASNWDIEYGATGFTAGSGTRISVTSNPAVITGLSANTTYDVYVRDSCALGDASVWVGPLSITTLCAPTNAPYLEDFSGTGFTSGIFFNDPGTIDNCWRRDNIINYAWKGGPPGFNPFNTGPNADHTTGVASGKYAFTQAIGFGGNILKATRLNTLLVDVSSLTSPELTFWYHMFGTNITSLEVLISDDGTNWVQEQIYTGAQHTSKADAWLEGIVDLSSYGDTVQVQFSAISQAVGTSSNIAIDDISINEAPSCPKPQNFVITGKTNSSVTLDWQGGGTATDWDVEYGSPGFAIGTGTVVSTTAHPLTISGLTPNTGYEFYVRDSCGTGDVSVWVGSLIDTTDCNPVNAPWTENFDGSSFTTGTFINPGNINSCWDREGGNYLWSPGQNGSFTFNTGPSGDHTSGSGKYLYSESFFGINQNMVTEVETQLIDLTALTIPEFSFWYHMFGSDIDSLVVEVSSGTIWNREYSVTGQQQNGNTDAWLEAIVDISSYANDTIKIRMTAHKGSTFSQFADIAIDDLDIHEQPTCPRPSNLTVTNIVFTGVTLNWTSGGALNWQIEYGPIGFTPGTGTIVNTSTNPHPLTGLNSSTTYDFYVRDSCSLTDQSDWFGPVSATTPCFPLLAPYSENFDGANFVPAINFTDSGTIAPCWDRNGVTQYYWTPGPPTFMSFGTGPSGDHTTGSGQYMYADVGGFGAGPFSAELETPSIDLSALVNPELTFWYHMFGSGIGSLSVEIDNGSGYTNLVTFSGQQQSAQTDTWKESITGLSAYVNDTVRLRFKATMPNFNFQSQTAIDDIGIDEAPSCPKPQNLQSTGTTSTSLSFSWTSGGASNWQMEYGPIGFASGTGTLIAVNTNPFTITGLSPNTSYDFYVRDSCGTTDVSEWFGPLSDTTDCTLYTAPYTENFDGSDWVPTSGFDPGAISPCWDRNATSQFFWTTGQNGTTTFNTGPSSDHTTGSGKFAFSEGFNGASTTLTSPPIDVSTLTAPELRFWYHMFGNTITSLKVEVFDGSTWNLETTISGQQQTSNTAAWLERIVDLSSYIGDTIKVRYKSEAGNFGGQRDVAIDDMWIGNTPTCAQPSNFSATASTINSITLNWTTGGATNWQIKYRIAGSTGNFITIPVTASPPFVLGSLNPSTTYEIYVQDSCGVGDVSFWLGPLFEGTQCGVVTAPWTESFDGGSWISGTGFDNNGNQIDPCWSRNTTIGQEWGTRTGTTTTFGTGPSGAFSGGKYIYREGSFGGSGTAFITSPEIYVPTSLVSPQLYFHYHMFGPDITNIEIRIDDGTGYVSEYTKTGQQQTSNTAAWTLDSVDLSAYSGDTITMRFYGVSSNFQGDMALDEISISGDNIPCADPTNMVTSNITTNSVDVSWTSTNPGLSQLNYYDIIAGPTGTTLVNVTSPQTIGSLMPNTTYVITVYDSCSAVGLSGFISDTIITSPCPALTADYTFTTSWLNASFTSTSVGADSLLWNFDGTATSSLQTPSFLYSAPGIYNVSLIAFNDCGNSDTIIKQVEVCDTLKADFNFTKVGDTITFNATTSIGANTFDWTLGNGTDSTGIILKYGYGGSGTYSVTLRVKNACGDSAFITKSVQICLEPIAKWTYNIISSGGGGMQVQFDGSISLNATQYDWDFGDGNTNTTSAIPVHTYITPSLLYKVRLIVRNDCGDDDTLAFRLNEIGLEEFNIEEKVDVYPNPADDKTVVEWNNEILDPESIQVYDAIGKLIYESNIARENQQNGKYDLFTASYPEGIYIVRILGNELDIKQELIIQR